MASQPKTCAECGGSISRKSATGRCRSCANARIMQSPVTRARLSATKRKQYATDPALRDAVRSTLNEVRKLRKNPGANLTAEDRARGNACQPAGSASRMRAGAKRRFTCAVNAGCPPHLVEHYYFLTRRKGLTRAEAIAAVAAQDEADMRRWRRSIGVVEEPAPEPQVPEFDHDATVLERVTAATVVLFQLSAEQLTGPGRDNHVVRARWAMMLALAEHPDEPLSQTAIGRELGRDRTSVRYGLKLGMELRARDPAFAELCAKVAAA